MKIPTFFLKGEIDWGKIIDIYDYSSENFCSLLDGELKKLLRFILCLTVSFPLGSIAKDYKFDFDLMIAESRYYATFVEL